MGAAPPRVWTRMDLMRLERRGEKPEGDDRRSLLAEHDNACSRHFWDRHSEA